MKKYLITGYSGFVSLHFLNYLELIKEDCFVLGVDINPPDFDGSNYQHIQCKFKKTNLLDKNQVESVFSDFQPDYILHLASYSSVAYSWKNPVDSFVNNTNIFLNLVDQIRLSKINCRILSVGSSEEYGNVLQNRLPLREDSAINPISPYAVARVSQEMLSQVYCKSYGLEIILTRSFNHIGPGQKEVFVIPSFAKKLIEIKKNSAKQKAISVGNIEIIRDFVDVRDVVKAYYLLLQMGSVGEVYNICSGSGHSLKSILFQMIEILDLEVDILEDKLLIRPNDNQIIIGSNEKIKNDLNWEPTITIEESISDIIKYWLNNIDK